MGAFIGPLLAVDIFDVCVAAHKIGVDALLNLRLPPRLLLLGFKA
jgi:hypothetical protein